MSIPTKTIKNLINSVDNAVTECFFGLCHAYPQLEYHPSRNIVFLPNIESRKNVVSLICGGGSGHEPFAAGFIGDGMLTASLAGSIFAAPPSMQIAYAVNRVASCGTAGILMIIPNYTGDCLNFGIAVQKARQQGIMIADVIVGEDCSIPKEKEGIAGRRGLTGLLFVIKIAGALAERGEPLQEVAKTAQHVADNMATYAVGLTACAIPGQRLMFEIGEDEIECGMGIHGEAGYERTKIKTASEVVALMLQRIRNSLSLVDGDSVAVIVNNFGALSQLEQGIVVHEVVNQLRNMGVQPMRVYSGVLMTSLNSSGVHVTLLKLPEAAKSTFIECLDAPTNAPRWPGCAYSVPLTVARPPAPKDEVKRRVDKIGIELYNLEQQLMTECLKSACMAVINIEDRLNELDRGCGDGDCGATLKRLANGIVQNVNNFYVSHPSSIFSEIAKIAEEEMGGSSGALYCLFFTAVAKELVSANREETWPVIWSRVFHAGLNCLMKYGKAKPGDRTMIDAMYPACETYEKLGRENSPDTYEKVAKAAWEGCNATKTMKPRAGRASYVKQAKYLEDVDAGAYAVATWISAVANQIVQFSK